MVCDCELRWYRQWIEEEWNEINPEYLKDTFCKDITDNKEHNIAEVPLKDMFCSGNVKDKSPKVKVSLWGANCQNKSLCLVSEVSLEPSVKMFKTRNR